MRVRVGSLSNAKFVWQIGVTTTRPLRLKNELRPCVFRPACAQSQAPPIGASNRGRAIYASFRPTVTSLASILTPQNS